MTTDRKRHCFADCPTKDITRQANYQAAKHPLLMHRNGYLMHDWAETAGDKDGTCKLLQGAGALHPRGADYIAINGPYQGQKGSLEENTQQALAILDDNEAMYGNQNIQWVFGNFQALIAQQPELFDNTGIIIYDAFHSLCNGHLPELLDPFLQLFVKQARKIGHAVLAINLSLMYASKQHRAAYLDYLQDYLHMKGTTLIHEDYRSEGHKVTMHYVRFAADAAALGHMP